ncbi:uncharacterized protein LOC111882448 [Lactuca sativa]|uniref:uncharacterized protein LOC111882448 n=1 Tax=Lactuca sativa TaxID=4236 RepID=UPI000CD96E4C|nr:uncharacterized protein LOC111882448 [Lactuca sativa]
MSQINAGGKSGAGSGIPTSNLGDSHGHTKECTYKDFLNSKSRSFDGTGGVIALTRWFEKTKSIFEICACPEDNKVKFAACIFTDRALTWWNGQVKSLTLPVANAMSWEDLKELMLTEYCPRGEMQKLEEELWNLKMKGSDITTYTERFSDLSLLCPGMVTPKSRKVERFIWGLTTQLKDAMPSTNKPPKESGGKKKFWNKCNGKSSQELSKKQQVVDVHAATTPAATSTTQTPASRYAGILPRCDRCNFDHHGPCREMLCNSYGKKGQTACFCITPAQLTNQAPGAGVGNPAIDVVKPGTSRETAQRKQLATRGECYLCARRRLSQTPP